MGLLGNLFKKKEDAAPAAKTGAAKRCAQCGKAVQGGLRKYEKDFCGPKCLSTYDSKNRTNSKQACEFC